MVNGGINLNPLFRAPNPSNSGDESNLPPFDQPFPGGGHVPPLAIPTPTDPRDPAARGMKEKEIESKIESKIENNPDLKKIFEKIEKNMGNQTPETQFSIRRVIILLIGLCRALQNASVVMADRLEKVTERLTAYSKKLSQVPVVLRGEVTFTDRGDNATDKETNNASERGLANQKFANMLEAVRANKGLDEDKAKKIQTIMQSMKDASASSSDFITAFTDLLRGVSSKIFR